MAFGSQYRQKLLKLEAEKRRLDRGVKEFLCARALFTYCKYVLFRIYDTESTDRVFLRYRYGNYREIPTDTDRKIPTRYGIQLYKFHCSLSRFLIPTSAWYKRK